MYVILLLYQKLKEICGVWKHRKIQSRFIYLCITKYFIIPLPFNQRKVVLHVFYVFFNHVKNLTLPKHIIYKTTLNYQYLKSYINNSTISLRYKQFTLRNKRNQLKNQRKIQLTIQSKQKISSNHVKHAKKLNFIEKI